MRISAAASVGIALMLSAFSGGSAVADCTCRAQGRDYDLGRSICLMTPTGFRLATCDMVLNNTSWKISSTPCVSSDVDIDPVRQMTRRGGAHRHDHRRHAHSFAQPVR